MAKIIGYDANRVGKQNVVVVYTETLHHSTSSSVDPQPTPDKPVNSVKTGDNSSLGIMTMVAGLAVAGMVITRRKEN